MADEALFDTHGMLSCIRAGAENIKEGDIEVYTLSVGAATAKVGYAVAHDDATDQSKIVDTAITTDENFIGFIVGVVIPDTDWDIDDVIADGKEVYVLHPTGGRVTIAAHLEATAGPVAVNRGDHAVLGTEVGKIRKWAYADAASETDSLEEKVGIFAQYHAGHATEDRIVLIKV